MTHTRIARALVLLALFTALPVFGATITVTSTADSGAGSLRQAIADAVSGDTINFSVVGEITLTTGQLLINKNLTITGPGAGLLAISGNGSSRVFFIAPAITVHISALTIKSGNSPSPLSGGGITNNGTLTLTNSTVSGSSAFAGGGIFNPGTLTLTNSTVSGNSATIGAGIFITNTLTLTNSTVSGNSAFDGGGIFNQSGGVTTLNNSTISGNSGSAGGAGGGILNRGTLKTKNTIMANQTAGGNCSLQAGTATSFGHNLSTDNTCSSSFTQPGDLNNTAAGLDPLGLQNNGGPTQTIALLSTSAAVNAVPLANCTAVDGVTPVATDQRGVSRPQGAACDIGAFELQVGDQTGPITSNVLANPNPVAVSAATTLSANIDDTNTGGSRIASAAYEVRDGAAVVLSGTSSTCPQAHLPCATDGTFDEVTEDVQATIQPGLLTPGVYEACVRGTDVPGNTGAFACSFLVVYDPSGGFVTGGGWINSPAGAYAADPTLAGKANFGFVSKYLPGANVPSGNTEFQFKAGGLNFKSTEYEWLVIAGPMAQYKGSGTINGSGDYGFLLTAKDSAVAGGPASDTFRLKIWNKATNTTVYDNGTDQAIGGGSIVIHRP